MFETFAGKLLDICISIIKKSSSMCAVLNLLVVPLILTITCYDQILSLSIILDNNIFVRFIYVILFLIGIKFESVDIIIGIFLLVINLSISQVHLIPKEISDSITVLTTGIIVRAILVTIAIYSNGKAYEVSDWILKIISILIMFIFLISSIELAHYFIIAKSYNIANIILNQRYYIMSAALAAYYIIENDRINKDRI